MLGQSSCPAQPFLPRLNLIPSSPPHRVVQEWEVVAGKMTFPLWCSCTNHSVHKEKLLLPGLSLDCISLRTPPPAPSGGSMVWICSALVPLHGQHTNTCSTTASSKPSTGLICFDTWWTSFPSPHSPQGCLFLFFFPRSSLLCSGKANLSSQRDGKKTHIHSLPHKSQAISLPEIIT